MCRKFENPCTTLIITFIKWQNFIQLVSLSQLLFFYNFSAPCRAHRLYYPYFWWTFHFRSWFCPISNLRHTNNVNVMLMVRLHTSDDFSYFQQFLATRGRLGKIWLIFSNLYFRWLIHFWALNANFDNYNLFVVLT